VCDTKLLLQSSTILYLRQEGRVLFSGECPARFLEKEEKTKKQKTHTRFHHSLSTYVLYLMNHHLHYHICLLILLPPPPITFLCLHIILRSSSLQYHFSAQTKEHAAAAMKLSIITIVASKASPSAFAPSIHTSNPVRNYSQQNSFWILDSFFHFASRLASPRSCMMHVMV
jgi:hypothetical protein